MADASGFGQIWQSLSVQSLSVFVDSAGVLVPGAYQFLADFRMLALSMRFPLFSLLFSGTYFSIPNAPGRAIHTNSHRRDFDDMVFGFSLIKEVILLFFFYQSQQGRL